MKAAGIIFILISAFSVGIRISASLKDRCLSLRQFLGTLTILENEISFSGMSLPQAFAIMSDHADGSLKRIYMRISTQMEEHRWTSPKTAAQDALEETPDELIGEILLELTDKLGKYDVEAQLCGIVMAKQRANQALIEFEEERSLRSKTYKTLSICAGLAAVILLL